MAGQVLLADLESSAEDCSLGNMQPDPVDKNHGLDTVPASLSLPPTQYLFFICSMIYMYTLKRWCSKTYTVQFDLLAGCSMTYWHVAVCLTGTVQYDLPAWCS